MYRTLSRRLAPSLATGLRHLSFAALAAIALISLGCGAPPARRITTPEPVVEPLPAVGSDKIWADGFGPSPRDAELDARRAVSEQIVSKVRSRSTATEAEQNGAGDRFSEVRIATESAFERAELIHTIKVVPRGSGFVARAALHKAQAARAYLEIFEKGQAAIARVVPVLAEAMATLDTSVLLSAEHSPRVLSARLDAIARVLAAVDHPVGKARRAGEQAISSQAAQMRQRAIIRLQIKGNASPAIQRGVTGEIEAALRTRGCRFTYAPHTAPSPGQPTANATLTLAVREHHEGGLHWRYLGLDLAIDDARTGRSVLRLTGMPRIAHGGGTNPGQAEQAVIKRLADLLPEKAGSTLAGLTCQ